jgi:flavin-dependent dehydrogenase
VAHAPVLVVGAGPSGLLAAIRARQLGFEVQLSTLRLPSPDDLCRIECLPAQMIALLVEMGVHPSELGVSRLFGQGLTHWRTPSPVVRSAPASAHVSRPALDLALLAVAMRSGVRIEVCERVSGISRHAVTVTDHVVIDASGRSAQMGSPVRRPRQPLVARTFVQPASGSISLGGFAIAAGPAGYAYRLDNDLHLALGVVGRGELLQGDANAVIARIRGFAPWLVQGLDGECLLPGSSGAASLQWRTSMSDRTIAIGDARIARDALASQGLALGFVDALHTVKALSQSGLARHRTDPTQELAAHRRHIAALIAESPFATTAEWQAYGRFLADEAGPDGNSGAEAA